jgi:hypothetical protein
MPGLHSFNSQYWLHFKPLTALDSCGAEVQMGRTTSDCKGRCRLPKSPTTPQIDAGPVYSNFDPFTFDILKDFKSCKLRVSAGNFLPVTTDPQPTSGGQKKHFFIAGDGRANENALLTMIQTVWLREHNRLCDVIGKEQPNLDDVAQFKLARAVRS